MQGKIVLFLAVLCLGWATPGIAQTDEWDSERIQTMYLTFLAEKGYQGTVDSDGDVQFDYEDRTYFLEVNEEDPEFFRLVLFNIWPIESEAESVQVALACDAVNREMKCAKAYRTDSDDVWISVELFVDSPDAFRPIFDRCLNAIEDGVDTLVENM